eukprot:2316900-Amphidinium_carterae.1
MVRVREQSAVEILMEESPVDDHQKNGVIERANWEVASLIRVLMHAAEEMHKTVFEAEHPIRAWATRYAGQLLSRGQKSASDGLTAYQRRKGKDYK